MWNIIGSIPAMIRILIIFAVILLMIKAKWSLGNAFLFGSTGLGLIFGLDPWTIAKALFSTLLDLKTISLTMVVSLILVLSHCLEKTAQMQRLLDRFKGLIPWPKLNLVIFPALIGLLPMPGGAIFSAPMVNAIGRSQHLSASQLSYTNYWFRHIWEYWWPLYPGVLLTTTLAKVDVWHLILVTMPVTIVAVIVGYRPLSCNITNQIDKNFYPSIKPFVFEAIPILIAIICGLAFGQLFPYCLPSRLHIIDKELGLILALLISIGWVICQNKMTAGDLKRIVLSSALLNMIYMVSAIMAFKYVLEDSGAVNQISNEMLKWHIPFIPIAIMLPFLVGMVTGITIAFVGATFPILISLIHSLGQSQLLLPYLMLALVNGFAGVLLSPLHLCLLLSNQYFQTKLIPVYRLMYFPIGTLILSGILYFVVLRLVIF
jgi:integral membrane protein (TIGR00529 family)